MLLRVLPPRQARGRRRSRVLPRRALAVAYSTRQARGRRRSRVLPRRALAVAYSTASPGARGSPPLSRRQEHTRSRAPLRLQMRTRRFQRNPPPVVVSRKTSGASLPKKQVRRKRAEAFSQDLDFFPPHNLRRPGSDGGLLVEGLPTGFDWSTRSPDQRGFPDLWNRVSQASPLPGSGGPLPSHLVFVPPGPSIGQAPIEARFPRGRATPGARVARVLYRLARRARASLAYYTALPSARASTFARPAASRLLLRVLPPRQARGRRR